MKKFINIVILISVLVLITSFLYTNNYSINSNINTNKNNKNNRDVKEEMAQNKSKFLVEAGDRLVLPAGVVPKNYNLHLKDIDLKGFVFKGDLIIDLAITKPLKSIVIHSIDIVINSAEINGQKASKIEYDTTDELAVLHFDSELPVTESTHLKIQYDGILNDKLKGFYRSKYTVNGEDRYIGTTQFEATDARRAFPCFDEPLLKATFDITMTVKSHLTALSNQPEKSVVENADGTKTFTFETTPKMSTYILAFIVGEFTFVEGTTKEGIRTRIYQCIGKPDENGVFALDVAVRALSFFIDYFQIPYPLKKCDHIAIPDFSFGAMENWGLITYRESILLTSDKTPLRTKQRIAGVIGHELAHQWFGNLVTMSWWSQLWLNEGFATYMGELVTDQLFPEWNTWLEFADVHRNAALGLDALENSHPIEVPVYNSNQINEIFDAISYHKGASVIQMLATRYGDAFRQGLNHYLTKHAYGNTNTEDLWASISLKANSNVTEFVDLYTKVAGYPVLSFKKKEGGSCCQYHLNQTKFRYNSDDATVDKSKDPVWNVHVKVQSNSGETQEINLNGKQSDVEVIKFDPKNGGWIKPNYGQTGYYRLDLDTDIIQSLIPAIKSNQLPAVDRLGLLADAFALSKAGMVSITVCMDLISAFENEREATIWSFIVDRLSFLSMVSENQAYNDKLNQFAIKLLSPVYKKLGFDPVQGESTSDTLLREKINSRLGLLGHPELVAECKKRFELFKNGQALPNDVRSVVLNTVVRHSAESVQEEVIELYKKSTVVSEKLSYLSVFGNSPFDSAIVRALDLSLSENVRSQDTYIVWYSIAHKFRPVAWDYFVKNFKNIHSKFQQSALFSRMISGALQIVMTEDVLNKTEKFLLVDNSIPVADRSIKQDLENIKANNKFFAQLNQQLENWLKNH